jgi:outer membrane lipoprotein-sorting protein
VMPVGASRVAASPIDRSGSARHAVNDTSGRLSEALGLMRSAGSSFATLRGEVRVWRHMRRAFAATGRGRRGEVSVTTVGRDEPQTPAGAVETVETVRVWVARPSALRVEREFDLAGRRKCSLLVINGDRWWSYHPQHGATTNGGDPNRRYSTGIDESMLDPSLLVAESKLVVVGRARQAGRNAIELRVRPRRSADTAPSRWGVVHDEQWLLDAQRGILLRRALLHEGEPFLVTEFVAVAFDEQLPAGMFGFQSPPGAQQRDSPRLHGVPLHEAAAVAPFVVYSPLSLSIRWRIHASLIEFGAYARFRVAVRLHLEDEATGTRIMITQSLVDGQPLWTSAGDAWRIVTRRGREIRVWQPDDPHRDYAGPRIAALDIAGTHLQISGNTSDDMLLEVAASLEPTLASAEGG